MSWILNILLRINKLKVLLFQGAIYGMAQSIPDKQMVSELAGCYIQAAYSTNKSWGMKSGSVQSQYRNTGVKANQGNPTSFYIIIDLRDFLDIFYGALSDPMW